MAATEFSTSHFGLSYYLLYRGFRLVRAQRVQRLYLFIFDNESRQAKTEANLFFSERGAQVDARQLMDSGVTLRAAIKALPKEPAR